MFPSIFCFCVGTATDTTLLIKKISSVTLSLPKYAMSH